MASKPLRVVRQVRSHAIDAPVAAFAGISVAFALFAMPPELFTEVSGLPGMSPLLAQGTGDPGLQRLIAAGAGALIVFAAVFLLLRGVDRVGRRPRTQRRRHAEAKAPRLRRRDLHPDAPAPRPIRAGRDLGEPETALPIWLADAEGTGAAAEPDAASEPDEQQEQQEQEDRPEPPPMLQTVEAAAVPGPSAPIGESIPALLARLEQGLADRRREHSHTGGGENRAIRPVFPDGADARLKSAIESLQRLAARHG